MAINDVTYDVCVIGAGIQGAGIAQAAAASGWRVLILEQYKAPAMGTSSKSSKLIHGGLRYLESFDFSLVFECLKEQKILLKNAPGLVKRQKFILPVFKGSKRGALKIYCGLWFYSLLKGDFFGRQFSRIDKSLWSNLNGLKTQDLKAVFAYEDAQTDDALLTQAVIESSLNLGSEVVYESRVEHITQRDSFFELVDQRNTYRAKCVVNATGPWVNRLAEKVTGNVETHHIDLVQGTHIVVDIAAPDNCFYLESPLDGRAFFVLPWKDKTMIGTTELLYTGDPADCKATEEEIDYLIESYKAYFNGHDLQRAQILSIFCGLRVLPKLELEENSGLSQRSRETLILSSSKLPGYYAVYGGKLTAYRATADKVIEQLGQQLRATRMPRTDAIPLDKTC